MRPATTLLLAALLFGSELLAQNDGSQTCANALRTTSFTSRRIDGAHPRYFVDIVEVDGKGRSRIILTSIKSPRDSTFRVVCERVNASVDRNSKIVIRPNRDYLSSVRFEGNFSIGAKVEERETSRAIEIPGYSMIGEEKQVAPVGVGSGPTMEAMLRELQAGWAQLDRRLGQEKVLIDSATAIHKSRASRLERRERQIREQQVRLATIRARHDTLEQQLAATVDSGPRSQLQANLTPLELQLTDAESQVDVLLREQLADSLEQRRSVRREFVGRGLAALRENRTMLLVLGEFAKPENLPLVRATARAQRRLPAVLVSLASRADSLWSELLTAKLAEPVMERDLQLLDERIEELSVAMREMMRIDPHYPPVPSAIDSILLDAVKDAEFNVRQTGAEAGDVIVLTLTDSVGVPPSSRSAEIRLPVREFGLVARVDDALLFTNTWREEGESARIAAATALANASGTPSSFELPVATRGSPTAGVSFGWNYSPRDEDLYASRVGQVLRTLASWLEPGFGFNATAANVAMRRLTIAPGKAPVEEAAGNHLAYALGGGLSLFNGALVWSGGWTLNGSRARPYTGLGISFLSATDKARELFKGLNP